MSASPVALRALERKQANYKPLPDALIADAKAGDKDALVDLFEAVFFDVYRDAYTWTGDQDEAERITRKVMNRLPSLLRKDAVLSIDDVRHGLLTESAKQSKAANKRLRDTAALPSVAAQVRHVALALSLTLVTALGLANLL